MDIRRPEDFEAGNRQFRYDVVFDNPNLSVCTTVYRQLPWMAQRVEAIFVSPITDQPFKYYDERTDIDISDDTYYRVNRNYYTMRCGGRNKWDRARQAVSVDFNGSTFLFRVAIRVQDEGTVLFNERMFDEEQRYLSQATAKTADVQTVARGPTTAELKNVAVVYLNDVTGDARRSEFIANDIERKSPGAQQFARRVARIYAADRISQLFDAKMKNAYYADDLISTLDDDVLFEGVAYDQQDVDTYTDDLTTNLLLASTRYYDIPERVYRRRQRPLPEYSRVDVRLRCSNSSDMRDVADQDLVFYREGNAGTDTCFDVRQLYWKFRENDTINPYTRRPFDQAFVDRVLRLYSFKIDNDASTVADDRDDPGAVEAALPDPVFDALLKLVIEKINQLDSYPDAEKCSLCQRTVGRLGVSTLDRNGRPIHFCGVDCMERV
ncbi:hypothetical protein AV955_gp079 [Diadromus pulchellus ascovirus 4a]|uniref:Complete DpAV4 genome n=1 Tax=Diadromus pulchellus ascovirus 4a TaxID=158683 RepID=F2NZ08_9VIRU|nr:hypothetical protein AV955_gp079 [Diadromus pulchellus ascovirus 4a]CCA61436.1 unnamed protein product [Diadromus pulchellus ascovirus 4a]